MYIKDEYKGIISKVNLLMEEYKKTGNENILSIVRYELYKIVKLHLEEEGLQRNEYASSTGRIIVNDVISKYLSETDNTNEKLLGEELVSTLNKMPLRKKVYQFEESIRKEDAYIQRYSYLVDKTMKKLDTLEDNVCYELLNARYEEICRNILKEKNMKNITKIAPNQLLQKGLHNKKQIFKAFKEYLREGEVILEKFLPFFDEDEQKNIKSYYINLVKEYFTLGYFYNGYDFEKYLFEELSKLNLSKKENIDEMYNESKRLKYKPETRV